MFGLRRPALCLRWPAEFSCALLWSVAASAPAAGNAATTAEPLMKSRRLSPVDSPFGSFFGSLFGSFMDSFFDSFMDSFIDGVIVSSNVRAHLRRRSGACDNRGSGALARRRAMILQKTLDPVLPKARLGSPGPLTPFCEPRDGIFT